MKSKKIYSLFLVLMLTSCSTMDSLRFWQNDEIDTDEPRDLISFSNQKFIEIEWKKSFEGENILGNFVPGFSSQKLFFSDSQGTVSSMNSIDGNILWTKELDFLASGTSAGFGIVVVSDTKGNVIALTQDEGTILWKSNVKGEVLSKAAVDAKLVIVKTNSGELIALDKDTGSIEWSYRSKLPLLTVRGSSSPVIIDDKIYTSFDNGRLGVFDLNSGFPLWDGAISYVRGVSELENLIDADSPPVVEGGLIYSTNYQGNLNIFDIAQQRSVWSYETSSFYSPVIIKGMLIIIEANSAIRSFAMQTMEESWLSEDYLNRDLSNAVSFKGDLAFGDFEGFVHIVDPLNGITVAREKISRKPIKTVFSRSNKLYAIDEAFNLFLIN